MDNLESRLSTTNQYLYKDLRISELSSEKTFKEDYYIQQLNRDTTLILFVIGFVFVIFGLLSFKTFEDRFSSYIAESESKNIERLNEYKSLEVALESLNSKVSFDNSKLLRSKSKEHLSNGEYALYLEEALSSIRYFSDYYFWLLRRNDDLVEMVKKDLFKQIEEVHDNIKNRAPIKLTTDLVINSYISHIRKTNDIEIDRLLSKIHSLTISQY
ncbi:hypothetical protein [Salinimicrobium sp. GXAS 041]|uniref:hypothetical protein n=1 Tax=Salinimicrobium sp. GXAS 041 TaxID=3400806 RepID=UPI003C7797AC